VRTEEKGDASIRFRRMLEQIEGAGNGYNEIVNFDTVSAGVGSRRERGDVKVSITGQQTIHHSREGTQDEIEIEHCPVGRSLAARPTFIKLDVEGADVAAHASARNACPPVQAEIFVDIAHAIIGQFGHTLRDFFQAIPDDIIR